MEDHRFKDLKHRISDYQRFSMILLVVSGYATLGAIIPIDGKTETDNLFLGLVGLGLLIISILFYRKVVRLREQLHNEET